jgi:hypothetical protein
MRTMPRPSPWLDLDSRSGAGAAQGSAVAAQTKLRGHDSARKPAATPSRRNLPRSRSPPGTNADTGWPRTVTLKTGTVVWYQPQVESWIDQKNIVGWSAVSYQRTGVKEPALGTIKIEGPTHVAVDDRVVTLDLRITQ